MRCLDEISVEEYLREQGLLAAGEPARVRQLGGGVSNAVFHVSTGSRDLVLKQARPQLRTAAAWFAPVERNLREVEVLRLCGQLLGDAATSPVPIATPRILYEDCVQFLFVMSAAPLPHSTWKEELLAGRFDATIAEACGWLLGTLHARTWRDDAIARQLGDTAFFDQLRLDPYYRHIARTIPAAANWFTELVDSVLAHPRSLVHADFSPKNLLVYAGGLMMVDFETGHFGDPAFDLGFFSSHLVLKAFYHAPRNAQVVALLRAFWRSYRRQVERVLAAGETASLEARGVLNLAGCAWARLDGKSTIEYLDDDPRRESVRRFCARLFTARPRSFHEVIVLLEAYL